MQGVHDDESRSDPLCRVDDPLQCVGDQHRSEALPTQGFGQREASQQDCRELYRPTPTDIAWNVIAIFSGVSAASLMVASVAEWSRR